MKTYRVAVLPGDGIGPEVIAETIKVLNMVQQKLAAVQFSYQEFSVGAGEYLRSGNPLPPGTLEQIRGYDAILVGAMGLPEVRWPTGTEMVPQLDLREKLDLYGGERPIRLYHEADTPLKGIRGGEIDFVLVRENTEGLFYSRKNGFEKDAAEVRDVLCITRKSAERVCRYAFRLAMRRRKQIALIDKANVLPSMAFFRMVFDEVALEFPEVETSHIYVDAASLFLVRRPQDFDVLVTENMFGDILSDLAAGLIGGMGMAPSADIGDKYAVFQPSHGTAPDITGQSKANPTATILSAAMMLDWLGDPESKKGAAMIRRAVEAVFANPDNRTPDMKGPLTTSQLGDLIAGQIA